MFDVRPGEYRRTICLTLYLMLVLFAYYIIKPVSRAIFLNKFDIDKLPWLYVLIAAVGGVLAYAYTKIAVKSSLVRAVNIATIFSIAVLVGFWWLIQLNISWIIYAFNIWVSLFSIILVSQGWLIATNLFTSREAKRLYGILGVGSVIGAAFGGTFTAFTVHYVGTTNLVLASAVMVALSYLPFWFIVQREGSHLKQAKAAETGEEFTFNEIFTNLRTHRHLQVIMAIMVITFMIDVMVEFQFNAMAKVAYHNKADLTAFLGNFYGFWLNMVTFIFQFFLTGFVVSRFGVGGTLQIMPVSIGLASIATIVAPGVFSTASARLTEASTRYSFNKTGMELLYLPLPLELRNRTKAFVDVFVDRMARGIGGMILVFLTSVIQIEFRGFAIVVMCFSAVWIVLSVFAKRQYVVTVRNRLDRRRLDLETVRLGVEDHATLRLLEETALSDNARQASFALSALAETRSGYDISPTLEKLATSPAAEVRARVFDLAAHRDQRNLIDAALAEIRNARPGQEGIALRPAVRYALQFSSDRRELAGRLLEHPNTVVSEGAIEYLAGDPEVGAQWITPEWLAAAAADKNPSRRRLAAIALRARGDEHMQELHALLEDQDSQVVTAAFRTAAALQNREYVPAIVKRLTDSNLRGEAIDALAAFGNRIVGTLGDLLTDESLPLALRRQMPRVLRLIPTQRSVDILLETLGEKNLTLRGAVLRALNRLRETDPKLDYGAKSVSDQILNEARYYYETAAALAAFGEEPPPHTAPGLLANTLRDRLKLSLERLFRLLGLRYPGRQIYAAYQAVNRGGTDEMAAALEFLDSMLDRDLKRLVVPMLDDPMRVVQRGRDLFGIEIPDVPHAIRSLLASGDEWLVSCAMAAAAELQLRELAPEITKVSAGAGRDVCLVAESAVAALS